VSLNLSRVNETLLLDGADAVLPHARSVLARQVGLRVLVLGDSVGAGIAATSYRQAFPWLWTNHLRQKHGCPVHLVNLSRAGETSAFGLDLAERAATQYHPDVAVVAFGINDQRRREPSWRRPGSWSRPVAVPVERFRDNILRTADRIRRRSGADVVLMTPCPLPGQHENERYRSAIAAITAQTEFVLADVVAAWPGQTDDVLDAAGLHPNDAGHRIYAETLCALGL
jgi:lysophospholipase L1-like esterase